MLRALKMLVSVPVIMACALGGTVGLLKTIERPLPDGEVPVQWEADRRDVPADRGSANTEGGYEMQADAVRDQMRRKIVERSIQVLRGHGKSDAEIRSMILNDFCMDEETLEELLAKNAK